MNNDVPKSFICIPSIPKGESSKRWPIRIIENNNTSISRDLKPIKTFLSLVKCTPTTSVGEGGKG